MQLKSISMMMPPIEGITSQVNFYTTFLIHCGSGGDEIVRTTTCLRTVVAGRQGYVPLLSNKVYFLCQLNFM